MKIQNRFPSADWHDHIVGWRNISALNPSIQLVLGFAMCFLHTGPSTVSQQRESNTRHPAATLHVRCMESICKKKTPSTYCRSKTQLGYHYVPLSELLYKCKYLSSCINGCCAKPAHLPGTAQRCMMPNTHIKTISKKAFGDDYSQLSCIEYHHNSTTECVLQAKSIQPNT